jgi:membrane protease YdiL (CAAX protease family)
MESRSRSGDGLGAFFALACGITWALALPAARAWTRHAAPSGLAVAGAGLSAFGPLLAALAVAGKRRELGPVFGRWRTNPLWIVAAFVVPIGLRFVATAAFVGLGGQPAAWFYPPATPEALAALVVFPLGEELGWRGFAQPRAAARFGLVRGSLVVGAVWGLWHLVYSVTPAAAGFDGFAFGLGMVELPLYAVVLAWFFERSGRSLAVAIAFHAAAHVDHLERAPRAALGLHALHLGLVALAAVVAARLLARAGQAERYGKTSPAAVHTASG